ncbi:serine/threonine protein kinase [Paenibacillus sp. y28]|uniref:serine/threonine protein kinase n=1 Tax=Paenibacillus sp. y28 TaxID=3129110 RepID=UPI0030199606
MRRRPEQKPELEYALRRNTVLNGEYKLKHVISSSELSIVYLATGKDGRKVAVKEFFPCQLALRDTDRTSVICRQPSLKGKYEELLQAFMREVMIVKSLAHPSIAAYVGHVEANHTCYFVTDYCYGRRLDELDSWSHPDVAADFFENIVLPLMDALRYIHSQGVLHRDIKPANIIIGKDGSPKLIDFGSAVYFEREKRHAIFTSTGYSPLEFYSERSRQGVHSDVYSLAATLYYYCCGQAPLDVSRRLFEDHLPPVRQHNKSVSPLLAWMIRWGLAVRQERRCGSVKLLQTAVQLECRKLRLQARFVRNRGSSR